MKIPIPSHTTRTTTCIFTSTTKKEFLMKNSFKKTLVLAFIATLSLAQLVYASTSAETPTLSTQPISSNVLMGTAHTLNVSANVSDGGTLSYQWFTNATASNEEGTAISGATEVSFTPSSITVGKFYYYVVVTNTNNSVTATVTSNVATVNVISITNAAIPIISTQPASGEVTIGATRTLTVSASVNDGGTLSYQWYRNSTANGTGGTAISGATNASYTTNATNEMGIYYYYVVVTNTNNSVPDNKTATVVSNVATLLVTPIFYENFEGTTHKFNIVNGSQPNKFFVGSAVAKDGTKSAYISNDNGTTNAYTINSSSVTHMYSSVTFPASNTPYTLTFDWRIEGESCCDYLKVFLVSTGTTPTAGVQLAEATPIGTFSKGGASTWNKAYISIPAYATQTTMRLVFSWSNDASVGTQPPAAIDNILLVFSPTIFSEDFEITNSFTIVNGSEPNKWYAGTAVAKDGTKSAYISNNNGTTNAYTISSSSVTHMYRNVTFPSSSIPYILTFDWRAVGEGNFDYLEVFLVPTTTTPTAGIELTSGSQLAGGFKIGRYNNTSTWNKEYISIPAYATQTTMRLVFSWSNDASAGTQPPAAIDNILLSNTMISSITIPTSPTNYALTIIKIPTEGGNVLVNGTNSTGSSTHSNGTQVSIAANPASGYVFTGWSGASTSTNNAISLTISGNRTITANFQKLPTTYSLTVNRTPATGGAVTVNGTTTTGSTVYDVGTQVVAMAIPADGYAFTGWSGASTSINASITLTMNSTQALTAKFETITYGITYHLNGGTQNMQNPATYLVTSNVTLSSPTRVGYTFGGWFDNVEFNGIAITSIPSGSIGNRDLYAKWTPTTYTITYTLNSGTVETANPASYTIETAAFTLNNPTRTGYTFAGWTGTNGTTPQTTVSVQESTGNKNYTANWTLITYTVTFNANGGTLTTTTGTTGTGWKLASLPTPTRNGYTFNGWFTEETGGTQVTANTVFSENTIIYARWTPTIYTITYALNSGTVETANPAGYTIETTDFTLNNPTRTGYTFVGWTGANGTTPQTTVAIVQGSTGNKSYTANWTTNTPIFPNRENPLIGRIGVQTTGNYILLSNLPSNAKVEVYNLQGKRIYSTTSHSPLATSHLKIEVQTKGMYIVKAGTQTMRVTVR